MYVRMHVTIYFEEGLCITVTYYILRDTGEIRYYVYTINKLLFKSNDHNTAYKLHTLELKLLKIQKITMYKYTYRYTNLCNIYWCMHKLT